MPHVIVKLWPGESEAKKKRLAAKITQDVMDTFKLGEESVSVAMEEIKPSDWAKLVYRPEIKAKWDKLYKRPGYDENVGEEV